MCLIRLLKRNTHFCVRITLSLLPASIPIIQWFIPHHSKGSHSIHFATLLPFISHSQFFKQTIPSFTTLCIQIITNIHLGLILQHQLRFPQKLPTELPHSLQNSRSRILHIRRAIRRTIHHTHPPFSLLMHNIERKRSCQHIKLISYSSLPLSIRTRQSQQINPLHFIAPIIDKSLVKQKHILRILHHHIPFVHSSIPSILRLLQIIREAFHPSIASGQLIPVIIHIQLPSIHPTSLTCCVAFRFRCEHTFRITQFRSSLLFFGATFTVLLFTTAPQSYAIAQSRREVQFDRIVS